MGMAKRIKEKKEFLKKTAIILLFPAR